MSRYLEILSNQRPFNFGEDENDRVMFSVNFRARAEAPVADWEQEILKILNNAGLATAWNGVTGNTLIGYGAEIPTGSGPWIQILDTGGIEPEETHDAQKYERLSCQIVVRASSYAAARTRILAIWRELDGKRNINVTAA